MSGFWSNRSKSVLSDVMVIRWAGNCSFKSEQLFLGQFSVNVVTAAKGMEPEVVVCNGKEKKEAKLELSSFSVTNIVVTNVFV